MSLDDTPPPENRPDGPNPDGPNFDGPGRGDHLQYLLTAYLFDSISEGGRREG